MKNLYYYLSLAFSLSSANAWAQWNDYTDVRNPICVEPGAQTNQQLCTDGANGAYIVWEDLRSGLYAQIYAQWIDSAGYTPWDTNGIAISDTALVGNAIAPSIAPDGANGCIIVWSYTGLTGNINTNTYAQRLGRSGNFLWPNNVQVDTIGNSHAPTVTPDGHGGAIINWYSDDTVPGQYQLFVQWLDSTGRMHFPQGGLQVSFDAVPHSGSIVATDGNYNAYIAFGEADTLRVLKVDSGGNFVWRQTGLVLSTTYDNFSTHYDICSDTKTGIIAGWADMRNVPARDDLYAQKLDTAGNILWGTDALLVDSTDSILHTYINTSPDGNGGAFFCFGSGSLYADRVTSNGIVAWAGPVPVDTSSYGENYPSMVADSQYGIMIAWDDQRNGTSVYAQRIDSNGNYEWEGVGVPVYTGYIAEGPTGTQIISLANGYAIAAMSIDSNDNSTGADIFAALFNGQPSAASGVVSVTGNMEWSIYPNPTTGQVYLRNNSSSSISSAIQIYNGMGQLLSGEELQFLPGVIQNINLQQLPDGVYFLKLTSEDTFSTVCIVKQGW